MVVNSILKKLKSVSGKFPWFFKKDSKEFQGSLNVSRVFHERLKVVSMKIEGCFKGILSGFKCI